MCHIDLDRTRITKRKKTTENCNCEQGRLNELPDHLLLVILSLLPLKSAIATAVLSRRWRWLWTNLFDIDIDINYNQLLPFLHNVLPKLTSPYIRYLGLNLRLVSSSDINISSWFDWAACRNKHIRQLRFVTDYPHISPEIPLWVFQLPCLVQLELKPWLVLRDDYADTTTLFNLPNLKKACVEFYCSDHRVFEKALEKLVSCSPLLEDLSFKVGIWGDDDDIVVNLSSRSLKRLEMCFTWAIHVVINAPNLDSISIRADNVPKPSRYRISFVDSPTALLACSIWGWTDGLDDDVLLPSNFFSVISGVRFLTTLDQNPSPLIAPITFRSLTHLQFKVGYALSGLALLQQCPALEVLTYDLHEYLFDTDFSWSFPDSAPKCLVTRLKRIEILAHPLVSRLEFILLQLLNYLLHNAEALELLRITITPPHRDLSGIGSGSYDEVHLIKKLFEVPRSSPLSRVEFYSPSCRVMDGGGIKSASSLRTLLD
ncbi:F-box/FBD/LRR-repeat protein At5g53840-like [Silene latifolia]|uniref:F-box/FBD/LRR-repeat protein At5g53840-like n=1 Tax=Silene latifolia TaxID=37657 RepID=UPI003D77F5CA